MLDFPVTVSQQTVGKYRSDGYVHLPATLLPEDVERFGSEITRQTLELNSQDKPLGDRDSYGQAFLQVMNLWRSSDLVKQFVFSRRLASIAAQLLEVASVRLYHDQSLYKEPSGGITPAHADQYYWPLASDRTVTAWIPLQPTPLNMGPLEFYKGSHLTALGRDMPISDESEARICANMELLGFEIDRRPYALGDVSFHAGWTFHRAGPNQSSNPRSVMTIIYMDADIKVSVPANKMQQSDLEQWLPGVTPGDIASSPLNPILW